MALSHPRPLIRLSTALRSLTLYPSRTLHSPSTTPPRPIPQPTPFVPDVSTFLTLIGRNLSTHASKIPTWEALFTLTGAQLRESGVEPARARRYLLWWRERFRNGIAGIGGDLKFVGRDGDEGEGKPVGELRIVEVPKTTRPGASGNDGGGLATLSRGAGMRKLVVNVPPSSSLSVSSKEQDTLERRIAPPIRLEKVGDAQRVAGVKLLNGVLISGKGVEKVRGHQGVARLRVQEGLWEQKRGHKVDGGERRKAMVRAKRRIQERKNAR